MKREINIYVDVFNHQEMFMQTLIRYLHDHQVRENIFHNIHSGTDIMIHNVRSAVDIMKNISITTSATQWLYYREVYSM